MKYTLILSALFATVLAAPPPCVCEEVVCTLEFPGGCICQNDAKTACFEKCGGVEPVLQDCTVPPTLEKKAPTPPKCVCEEVFCTADFPGGCICQNNAKTACYEKCGGVKPVLQDCTFTPPALEKKSETPYQRCGSRGLTPCAGEGEICINDPFRREGDCGTACDKPGYCVVPIQCGGFAGIGCPEGHECVEDERDNCDFNRESDCFGMCFKPQK